MVPKAVLIGLPGSGKSTIGRRLAKALQVTLLDTDAAIEQKTGRSIAELFATDGEQEFRRVEAEVVRAALDEHDGVLSLGGGAVISEDVRDALAGHTVVYLEISAAEGVRRTSGNTVRPLLAGPDRAERYRELMAERVPLYRRVATIRVNTNRRNPGAVVRHIVGRLEDSQQAGPKRRRRPAWRRNAERDALRTSGSSPVTLTAEASSTTVTPATLAARSSRRGTRG